MEHYGCIANELLRFDLRHVRGHIEVFHGSEFVLSADTVREAIEEVYHFICSNALIQNK